MWTQIPSTCPSLSTCTIHKHARTTSQGTTSPMNGTPNTLVPEIPLSFKCNAYAHRQSGMNLQGSSACSQDLGQIQIERSPPHTSASHKIGYAAACQHVMMHPFPFFKAHPQSQGTCSDNITPQTHHVSTPPPTAAFSRNLFPKPQHTSAPSCTTSTTCHPVTLSHVGTTKVPVLVRGWAKLHHGAACMKFMLHPIWHQTQHHSSTPRPQPACCETSDSIFNMQQHPTSDTNNTILICTEVTRYGSANTSTHTRPPPGHIIKAILVACRTDTAAYLATL